MAGLFADMKSILSKIDSVDIVSDDNRVSLAMGQKCSREYIGIVDYKASPCMAPSDYPI